MTMYCVISILLVSVSARDISEYNQEPRRERFDGAFVNPPRERGHRNRQYNAYGQSQDGYIDINTHHEFHEPNYREFSPGDRNERNWNGNPNQGQLYINLNNHQQYNKQNNAEFNSNNRHDSRWNVNENQGRSHSDTGSMDINVGFDRQSHQNRHEYSNLNEPRQRFNINNEYSNRDDSDKRNTNRHSNRNDKYNENILNARRRQDEVTLEDNNRETQNNQRNPLENQSNNGVISFLNNLNNNTNRDNQNANRNNNRNSGFINNRPKTVIENEVTQNPIGNDGKGGITDKEEEWVWGIEATTAPVTPVTLDDRAAFSGDSCATGFARFHGKCVPED